MRKVDLYEEMRADGMTYQEIADACGCTHQNVSQTLARYRVSSFRAFTKDRCCWDGLRNWLNDNKISLQELIRRKYGRNHTGSIYDRMHRQLRGEQPLRMVDIDFFRELTGLTYEQLFCSQEGEDE